MPLRACSPSRRTSSNKTDLRNRVAVATAGHDERGDNGQGQRDLDLQGGSLTEPVLNIDRAADFLDVGFDDVHAHAAARNIGHLFGGREPGKKDQVQQFAVAHAGCLVRRDQALFQGLLL